MNIELVTSEADLAVVAMEWDALARLDRRDGFFRTSAWYRAWMKHIRPEARPFILVARDETRRAVGLAPLCRVAYNDLGFRNGAISWGGREVVSGDFLDFVADSALRPQVTTAFTAHLLSIRDDWGLLVAGELIADGQTETALIEAAQRTGLAVRRQETRLCPYIQLADSFDGYLASLGSSTRYHIRRRQRDVVEKKGAVVECYSAPSDVTAHLEVLFKLHCARWSSEGLPGTLGRPGFDRFLNEVCGHPPDGASSALYLLRHEGAPVAAILMFYFGDTAIYYQAGWDPGSALAPFSPAVVLMARTIEDAIQKRCSYYEFLRGDEPYKARWTTTSRTTSTLLLAGSGMAKAYLAAARVKDSIKKRVAGSAEGALSGVSR
jgi:CelD/BcsL family acetyltransferase involved in cellulose biosynthesis